MQSSFYKSKDAFVVILEEEDIKNSNLGLELHKIILESDSHKVVLDVSKLEFILSKDIETLNRLVSFFTLGNISTIVCGFSTSNASMIFNFVDEVKFQTALNIEDAINAHKNNE
jgi:hypothetical protein